MRFRHSRIKMSMKRQSIVLFGLLILATPVAVQAQFSYTTNSGAITITGYTGSGGAVVIPDNAKAYYLPGTIGWVDGIPTELWTLPYPLILNRSPNFGLQTNEFGFAVSWATNLSVVVEAATDLGNAAWAPVATNALSGGTFFYFADSQWTKYPSRFYRVRSQ